MKLLFWIALFVLVFWALRDKGRKKQQASASRGASSSAYTGAPESMLQCCHCGVYFPASEAVRNSHGDLFCSEEHLRLFNSESGAR